MSDFNKVRERFGDIDFNQIFLIKDRVKPQCYKLNYVQYIIKRHMEKSDISKDAIQALEEIRASIEELRYQKGQLEIFIQNSLDEKNQYTKRFLNSNFEEINSKK